MTAKELQRQHETITQDQRAWRQRRDDLAGQRDEQRARAAEGRTRGATALATLAPDERSVEKARKETAAAEESAASLEAAIHIAEERIQSLEAVEERAARQMWALTARQEVKALLDGYRRLDQLWAPVLRQLQELAEHEDDVAALLQPRLGTAPPTVSGRALLALLLWRLNDQLGHPLPDLARREDMISAAEHAATRFASVLQQLEAELAN